MLGAPACRDPSAELSKVRTRILVVEDHAAVREAIVAALCREPTLSVHEAGSLADALTMLGSIDLAILDLNLPDGNGADLIDDLAAVNPDAKVVVFTASIDPVRTELALERGATVVLDKLADFDALLATVKRLQRRAPLD
jgi:DNA-binding NarL/FixJ family response regulator